MNFIRHFRQISALRLAELAVLAGVVMFVALAPKTFAAAGIYRPINYQGKLSSTGGVAIANGQYNMRFKVFSAPTGGVALWTETWNGSSTRVTSTGGLFSIALGSITTMTGSVDFNSDALYLQVEFDPGNDGTYEEVFTPRRRFASVPYAHNANTLDGLDSTQFLRSDADATASGTITVRTRSAAKIGIDIISNGGSTATGALRLSTAGGPAIVFGSGGVSYDTNLYRVSANTLKTDDALQVVGTLSGSRIIVSGNANISGALLVKNNITTLGTLSGYNLTVSRSASISGTLIVKTGITSKGSVSGSTIDGFGLGSCSGTFQKLLYNASTDKFECGSISTSSTFGTGNVLTIGDARYVKKSGDTMTGTLVLSPTAGSGVTALRIVGKMTLTGSTTLQSSAAGTIALVVKGAVGQTGNLQDWQNSAGTTLASITNAGDLKIFSAGAGNPILQTDNSGANGNGRLVIGAGGAHGQTVVIDPRGAGNYSTFTSTAAGLRFVSNAFFDGVVGIGTLSAETTLEVLGTISGSNLFSTQSITGSHLYAAATFNGAGLADCDTAGTSKLLWDSTTKRFSCGADSNTGTFGTGNVLTIGDARYLKRSGGTMTGVLVVDITSGNFNTIGLKIINTLSGAHLHAERTLTSSGTLVVEGATTLNSTAALNGAVTLGSTISQSIPGYSNVLAFGSTPTFTHQTIIIGNNANASFSNSIALGHTATTTAANQMVIGAYGAAINTLYLGNGATANNEEVDFNLYGGSISNSAAAGGDFTLGAGYNTAAGVGGSLIFKTGDASLSERMRILSNGNVGINTTAPRAKLEVNGSMSGMTLFVQQFSGAGLVNCDAATQTLRWNATTERFSCGTSSAISTGAVLAIGDARYVKKSGDTMTGALAIDKDISSYSATTIGNQGHIYLTTGNSANDMAGIRFSNQSTSTEKWFGHVMTSTVNSDFVWQGYDRANSVAKEYMRLTELGSLGLGTTAPKSQLDVVGTISGSRLSISNNANISGALLVKNNITSLGTLSGYNLTVSRSASISGTLIVKTGITSKGSVSGSTIDGFGLGGCTGAYQKLLYNASTDKFECGSISTSSTFGTGNVLTIGDARYLRRSGGTMTGQLVVDITGGGAGTIGLNVRNTISGAIIHAEKSLTSSGNVNVWGNVTARGTLSGSFLTIQKSGTVSGALLVKGTLATKGILSGATLTIQNSATISGATVIKGILTAKSTISGSRLIVSGHANISGALLVKNNITSLGTLSGYNLTVSRSASISGTLIVKTGITSKGSVSGSTIDGFGLGGCTGTYQKLMYNASTDKFECGSIATTSTFGTGNVLTIGDARYVKKSGDTMTGALIVDITGGNSSTLGLNVKNTISGSRLIVSGHASVSGALLVKNNITTRGTLSGYNLTVSRSASISGTLIVKTGITSKGTVSGSTIDGFGLGGCTGTYQKLMYNASTDKFECGSIATTSTFGTGNVLTIGDARYVRKSGDTMTGALVVDITGGNPQSLGLNVKNTISGSRLIVSGHANISGALLVVRDLTTRGTLSGYNLTVSRSASISGTLIVKTGITSKGSVSGSTIDGFGLGGCTGTYQKLMYNASTDKFECGSISTSSSFGTGNVLTIGDARYVRKSGDTMTGVLVINITNGNINTLGLRVINTISGAIIHGERAVTSSGLLMVTQTTVQASGALVVEQRANSTGAYLRSRASANPLLVLDTSLSDSSAAPHILFGYNGFFDVSLFRSANQTLSLSGHLLPAGTNLYDLGSDAKRWRDLYLSGGTLHLGASGDEATIGFNSGANRFDISANGDTTPEFVILDNGNVGIGTSAPKAHLDVFGTISGSRLSISNNANISGALLVKNNITSLGTLSGYNLTVSRSASISGTLIVKTGITSKGSVSGSTIDGFGLGGCTGAYQKLMYNASTDKFECGSISTSSSFGTGNVLTIGNARYVSKQGDTMTGALVINITGGNTSTLGLNVKNTISGSRLIVSGHASVSGALLVKNNITTRGTLSGYNLTVSRSASISGTLIVKTGITSKGSVSGSTIDGFGLGSCSGTFQKLLYNASTDKFECGSISTSSTFGTGNVLTIGNARYVSKQGDTMTGALVINITGGNSSTLGLNVKNTISGSRLIVSGHANISGALLVKNNITSLGTLSGYNLTVSRSASISGTLIVMTGITSKGSVSGSTIDGFGLGSCSGTFQKLLYNASTDKFECGTISTSSTFSTGNVLTIGDARYVKKSGDTMTGALVINITGGNPSTLGLNVKNTISGSRLIVSGHTSVSGALLVVRDLTTRGTLSGYNLTVSRSASISGTLIVKTGITSKGSVSGSTIDGFGLGSCNGASQKLLYNASTDKFECGTITAAGTFSTGNVLTIGDARYVKKSGDTMTGTLILNPQSGLALNARGTISGSLITQNGAGNNYFMGNVGVGTTNPGAALHVMGSIFAQGTGFESQTNAGVTKVWLYQDQTKGMLNLYDGSQNIDVRLDADGPSYFNGGSVGIGTSSPKAQLDVIGTISGSRLSISNNANISGALLVKNNITTRGTLSGYNLTVSRSASISGTLIVKTGITSKGSVSGSTIDGFGLGSCSGATQKLLYNSSTDKFECGTISAAGTFSTGNVLTIGDARYVKKSGDTMTGTLVLTPQTGLALNARGTISGARLIISNNAAISGSLVVRNSAVFGNGTALVSTATVNIMGSGPGKYQMAALTNSTLSGSNKGGIIAGARKNNGHDPFVGFGVWDTGLRRIAYIGGGNWLTPDSTAIEFFTASSYDESNGTPSNLRATISGNGLEVIGNISGSSLFGFGLGDCASSSKKLTYNNSTGKFSCQDDLTAGTGLEYSTAAAIFVNQSGDTMTGALVIDLTGGNPSTLGLNVKNTMSGSRLIVSGNASVSGALLVKNNITSRGTLSGYNLTVSRSASISGTLIVKTGITSKGSVSGSTIDGFGLGSCNGATQKLLYNASTDKFECGTISAAGTFSTGNVLTIGDARYVRKSGDTMTGALVIDLTGGNPSTLGLNVKNTISGSRLIVSGHASVSGSLLVKGALTSRSVISGSSIVSSGNTNVYGNLTSLRTISGSRLIISGHTNISGSLLVKNTIATRGILSGSTLTIQNSATISGATVIKGILTAKSTISGSRLIVSGHANISGALLVKNNITTLGTLSGYNLTVSRSASISGTLIVKTGITSKGSVSGSTIDGFGLGSCNGGSSKLLYNSTTDKFECGTISASGTFGTGNVLTIGDARYLRRSGGTMTGALVINITGGNPQTLGLDVKNTISGSRLIVSGHANISGSLLVKTSITSQGSVSGSSLYGFGLGDCSGSDKKLIYNNSTGKFSCSNDLTAGSGLEYATARDIFVNQSGDTMTGALIINVTGGNNETLGLRVLNTVSGSILHAEKNLTSSGTIVAETSVYVGNSIIGSDDEDTTIEFLIDDRMDFNVGGAYMIQIFEGVNDSINFNPDNADINFDVDGGIESLLHVDAGTDRVGIATGSPKALLDVLGTISGSRLIVSGHANISGALLVVRDLTTRGTLSGSNLTVSRFASISGTLIVKTGITSKGSVSGSTIDGFGLGSCNGATQKLLYNSTTDKFECGTISAAGTFSTGNVLTIGDARYVRKSGDTMTGTLIVQATMSGRHLIVSQTASFSGAVVMKTNAVVRGALSGSSLYGFGLGDCSASNKKLTYNNSTGKFSCQDDLTAASGLEYSTAAAIFVNQSGDTMTGALVIDLTGGNPSTLGLNVKNTISGSRLIVSGHANISGALLVKNNITTLGTLSGYNLTVSRSASISGTLIVKTGITSKGSVSGSTIDGFGLGSCNGATQKLLYNSTTDKFECGTISAAGTFSTGNVLTIGDARYVRKSGDTMTGTLVLTPQSGLALNARGTISGSLITQNGAGANYFMGRVGIGTNAPSINSLFHLKSEDPGMYYEDTTTGEFWNTQVTSSATRFNITAVGTGGAELVVISDGVDYANAQVFIGSNILLNSNGNSYMNGGSLGIGKTVPKSKLDVVGTISGSRLSISGNANITGSLVVKNTLSGSSVYGFGLGDCSSSSKKLTYNNSTGKFSCADDLTAGSGLEYSTAANIFVNQSGDTMTGALIIDLTGGNPSSLGLNVKNTISGSRLIVSGHTNISGALLVVRDLTTRGTLSGYNLTVSRSASISGTLIVKTGITSKGSVSGSTIDGFGLGSCNSGTSKLLYNSTTDKFECGTISASASTFSTGNVLTIGDARYLRRSGGTMTGQLVVDLTGGGAGTLGLKVVNTISGAIIHAERSLTSSGNVNLWGNVMARGTLSGSFLTIQKSGTVSGALLVKGTLATKGILSGSTLTIQNSATISGATVIKGILTAKSTISGSRLIVSGHANISGALLVVRNLTTRGTLSGYNLAVSRNATISGSLLVKTLIGSKGILSGATLTIQNSGTVSGALLVKSMLATKGILSGATLTIQNSATISGATVIKGILTAKSTISGSRLIVSGHANISGSLLVLRNITTRGTLSGEILYANKILSSSGILMVTQKQIRGSGALVVDQRANSTGAFITVSSFTNRNPVLVLENNRIGTESPHIMFGYRGTFDVNMRRSDVSTLAISGSVIVENTLTVQVFGDATATTVCRTSTGMLAACSSSLRYKEDVQELAMGLDTIREMRAVNFKWKGRDERDFGFIAEEMELINPLLVEYNAQGQVQGVKYMQLSAILTNAVQTLDARLLGITNDSGSILHARDLITSSGSLRIVGMGAFGSGILLNTTYTNGAQDVLTVKSNVGGSGNTVFRVNASGAVYSDSTFNSQGADYAEWFKSPENNLQPGDLVCVDVLQDNSVRKCARAGDPNLMGIVSTNPAFIGNNLKGADGMKGLTGYALVGLIGQVPAKVSLENGVIRPGDSLTSASVAGFARKAKAGESTVGVALEGYDGTGKAVINVLISRRNQSLTVETLEQKVLDSIAEMNLSDEIQQMVQSVSENLDLDDRVSAALESELQSLDLSEQINTAIDSRLSGATLTAGSLTTEQISLIASAVHALATNSGNTVNNDAIAMIGGLSARVLRLESAFSGSLLHAAAADFGTLSVRGTATFGSGMTIVGNSTIGPISISGTGVTIGSLVSSGSLKVMGPITVAGLAEFLGDVHIKGELTVSNRQAGFAVIAKTGTSVTVVFETPLTGTPAVNATPQGRVGSEWWIENSSMTGFTLRAAMPVVSDVRFSWTALSAEDPTTVSGAAASSAAPLTPFPVNALNQPVSSDAVWNGCIQSRPVLDSDGHPLSCARYHDGFVWQHPDLNISFTYNPNHEPPIMILPEGYVATPTEVTSSSSSSFVTSSESSSSSSESSVSSSASSSESSVSSSASSESSVSSSASSESSISSSASSESSSSAPSEPEPKAPSEPPVEITPPTESADPAPAPTVDSE